MILLLGVEFLNFCKLREKLFLQLFKKCNSYDSNSLSTNETPASWLFNFVITCMITDQMGLQSLPLPLLNNLELGNYFPQTAKMITWRNMLI